MFKVGDKVRVKNGLRLSVDVNEAEIVGVTEDGLYEISVPAAQIALHEDYLEPIEDEQSEYFTGEAVYICDDLKEFVAGFGEVGFTKGKIYVFSNGYTIDDEGDKRPSLGKLSTILNGIKTNKLEHWGFYPIIL